MGSEMIYKWWMFHSYIVYWRPFRGTGCPQEDDPLLTSFGSSPRVPPQPWCPPDIDKAHLSPMCLFSTLFLSLFLLFSFVFSFSLVLFLFLFISDMRFTEDTCENLVDLFDL